MKAGIFSFVSFCALMLIAFAPVEAQQTPSRVDQIISVCKKDLMMYQQGDKTWIERQMAAAKLTTDQKVEVLTICYAWGQGLIAGAKLSNARTI